MDHLVVSGVILLTTGETLVHHDAYVTEGKLIFFIYVLFIGGKKDQKLCGDLFYF